MACESVTVSSAGLTAANGIYNTTTGPNEVNYIHENTLYTLRGDSIGGGLWVWTIRAAAGGPPLYSRTGASTSCPGGITLDPVAGAAPGAVITENVPSSPTFGLPADVVALITSRFGTVANFLRLRNQGQV